MSKTASTDTTTRQGMDEIVDQVRQKCLTRGKSDLTCFSAAFRQFDNDYSRELSFKEFQVGFRKYGVAMTEEQELDVFKRFDRDGSGLIDFNEFCHNLIPNLEGKRLKIVEEVFAKLDTTGDGLLEAEDIMELLSKRARCHPRVQSGEWTEKDCLDNLLAAFEQPETKDGVVSLEEFVSYYTAVSWCVQDDASFEEQLKASWDLR